MIVLCLDLFTICEFQTRKLDNRKGLETFWPIKILLLLIQLSVTVYLYRFKIETESIIYALRASKEAYSAKICAEWFYISEKYQMIHFIFLISS